MKKFRKTFLINPKFQIGFIAYMTALSLWMIALQYGSTVYFFKKTIGTAVDNYLSPAHIVFQFIAHQQKMMFAIYIAISLFNFGIFLIFGLLYSHKIAGSMYRLKKHLIEDAKNKTLTPLNFRSTDLFREVADAYNNLSKSNQKK